MTTSRCRSSRARIAPGVLVAIGRFDDAARDISTARELARGKETAYSRPLSRAATAEAELLLAKGESAAAHRQIDRVIEQLSGPHDPRQRLLWRRSARVGPHRHCRAALYGRREVGHRGMDLVPESGAPARAQRRCRGVAAAVGAGPAGPRRVWPPLPTPRGAQSHRSPADSAPDHPLTHQAALLASISAPGASPAQSPSDSLTPSLNRASRARWRRCAAPRCTRT